MFTLLIRSVFIYILVLFVLRLMGKRQLGQMQPFEFVLTLILADLATIPMAESSVPVLHGIVPLLTLAVLHFFLTVITRKSDFLNKIISGKPTIVINPDGIDYKELKKLNISIDDLFEAIRSCGFFSIDEVQYAIVETNGTVSVLPKKTNSPLTIEDVKQTALAQNKFKLNVSQSTIPVTLISDGKLLKNNFEIANVDEAFLNSILKQTNSKNTKNILLLTIDGNGKIYFQLKNGKGKVFKSGYKKEIT